MTKPHILQVGPYPDWDQGPLDDAFHVHRLFEAKDRTDFLAKVGPQVRAIATRGELGANAAMIAACPNLEVISVYGVGYDAVDLIAARARGKADDGGNGTTGRRLPRRLRRPCRIAAAA